MLNRLRTDDRWIPTDWKIWQKIQTELTLKLFQFNYWFADQIAWDQFFKIAQVNCLNEVPLVTTHFVNFTPCIIKQSKRAAGWMTWTVSLLYHRRNKRVHIQIIMWPWLIPMCCNIKSFHIFSPVTTCHCCSHAKNTITCWKCHHVFCIAECWRHFNLIDYHQSPSFLRRLRWTSEQVLVTSINRGSPKQKIDMKCSLRMYHRWRKSMEWSC